MVRPKKHLGQHFLTDENTAKKIANALIFYQGYQTLIEIGPGTGMLTRQLLQFNNLDLQLIEIDSESVAFLKEQQYLPENKIMNYDFLKLNLNEMFHEKIGVIGNFPYNISSQILFKIYENHQIVSEVVGMFQKEVARRIASGPGNKEYGILSVLLNAFYNIEYLFTVNETVFFPPPKVKSAVLRLTRNERIHLECGLSIFTSLVKAAFNQRRKTLKNALSGFAFTGSAYQKYMPKRAEQLSTDDFIELALCLER